MRRVYFVSDSTGITAETLGRALLSQFDHVGFEQVTLPFVSDVGRAEQAVMEIVGHSDGDDERPIVFSTITDPKVFEVLSRSRSLVLDLFSAFITPLEQELGVGSSHALGKFHAVGNRDSYQGRMHAVDFALSHDDGASIRHYELADILLIGVSRSGKTPTCVYLAMQFGIKAANDPLTEEDLGGSELPGPVRAHRERLFGLTIEPERLAAIRAERRRESPYASLARCRSEVRAGEALMARHRVPFLNTSRISVEEIASRILLQTGLRSGTRR